MIWNALFMSGCANGVTTISAAEQPLEQAQKHELDAFVESALERYNVPGAAIAVIRDGKVIHQARSRYRS
jgi:CubicO group peptidase (beta-lactamase class C family)